MKDSKSMMVVVTKDGDEIPSAKVLADDKHFLSAEVDPHNRDIYLTFSSRDALHGFAMSLLQEAAFGTAGEKEFYPLLADGKALVVDGARLAKGSSRIFLRYATTEDPK